MQVSFIFKSERLGFRNWHINDLEEFTAMNADEEIMEYFPSTLSKVESKALLERLQEHYSDKGYTYYAVIELNSGEFLGFIGLAYQDYKTSFNPSVDIGWRLKKSAWGKGFATEGAKRCLQYAFEDLKLDRVISICTYNNVNSERVMQKIGMNKKGEFNHPKLIDFPNYKKCLLYDIKKS